MEQLLATKFFIPPPRVGRVSRPRLIEALNQGLRHKLTLISAPAGFGKTTLVSEWVEDLQSIGSDARHTDYRIAWLSLDDGDNDPAVFLAYFITALNQIGGKENRIGTSALKILQSPPPTPVESVLTSLINDIAAISGRIILIIDDYHTIDSEVVDDAITFTIEHLPPQIHLVIASRHDPALKLSRLRARDQLTELRARNLRFTFNEAAEFLNQVMGLALSADNIKELETRTEGWIAGLQLAAHALQGTISTQGHSDATSLIKSFTGSNRYVLDYLIEEVLDQQTQEVQTFLLRTSILKRMTGALCDAITNQTDGQATLEMLGHENLFIVPLDAERRWYRYHQLFADLLRSRLRQTSQEIIPKLHNQASVWYEQVGSIDDAIDHAFTAQNFNRAADLIEQHVDDLWRRGEHSKLRRWLASLPGEMLCSRPHLCILHAWNLFTSGQQEAAEQTLLDAERVMDASPDDTESLESTERMKILGRVAAIRAFLATYRGDMAATQMYASNALEHLPEGDLTWRSTATVALGDAYNFCGELTKAYNVRKKAWEISEAAGNLYMNLIASMKLAVTMRQLGQLGDVIEICQQQMQLATENGLSETVASGWLLAIWGEVLAEKNEIESALRKATKGVDLTKHGSDLAMLGWSNLCLLRVLISQGDLSGAEEVIQQMYNIARDRYIPPWITLLLEVWQARIWLMTDRLALASEWVETRGLDADADLAYPLQALFIMLARVLIAEGKRDQATNLLERLLEAVEHERHTSRAIEILILMALNYQAEGDTNRAMDSLQRSLELAAPKGFIRIYLDEGPPMAQLLYQALSDGVTSDYIPKLLAAFPKTEPMAAEPSARSTIKPDLIEPLSDREIEVLQLIAAGFTNPEIATRLYLSLNTVKVHSRNIYGKLGVNNRTQAVARGRALRILSPT